MMERIPGLWHSVARPCHDRWRSEESHETTTEADPPRDPGVQRGGAADPRADAQSRRGDSAPELLLVLPAGYRAGSPPGRGEGPAAEDPGFGVRGRARHMRARGDPRRRSEE